MSAIHVTLPDGSSRELPAGSTGRDLAAAQGAFGHIVATSVRDSFES